MREIKLDGFPDERFWKYVDKDGEEGCWVWTGGLDTNGYATFHIHRKTVRGHRVSYKMEYGEIPDGKFVLHKCANSRCVNPDHLYIGTHSENMKDSYEHGNRSVSGSDNPNAKLTEDDVREIRELHGSMNYQEIGQKFGVSGSHAQQVALGDKWPDVE